MLRKFCPLPRAAVLIFTAIGWLNAGPAFGEVPATEPSVRVAIFADAGASSSGEIVFDLLSKSPEFSVEKLSGADIRAGRLADFDVLVQGGGSGSKQAASLEHSGREQVREFVQNGGGYLGICAGAYLATCQYSWSLHILDARVVDREHWNRGYGQVELELTTDGRQLLGIDAPRQTIYYHQGPLLAAAGNADVPDYTPLATFATEIARNGAPPGVMTGTTAIAAGEFGQGRVFCFSPHPERTEGLEHLVARAIRWTATTRNDK